ncbi:MAG: V-type ATPase subunit [Synergistaceae bacterium]|nr:V-type ATPase subunit [Synergistaceae bacterium]
MSSNRSPNYEYLNSRLRARLGSFIEPAVYRRLSRGTIRELELFLLDSAYAESYRAHLVSLETSPLARIEMAVSLGIAERIRTTVNLAQGEPRELMKVVTNRSDLHNARMVLRGLALGHDPLKKPSWHAYGELSPGFFDSLWNSKKILDAREKCLANGDPLALALGEALEVRQRGETLPLAERHLLNAYLSYQNGHFRKIGGTGSQTALEVMGRSVDLWNIGIWFRNRREKGKDNSEPIPFLQFGKWLSNERLETSDSVRALVGGTPWFDGIRDLGIDLETVSPRVLQREFNSAFWRWQSFLYRRNLLGFEVAVSYLARLLLEWQNINILAVGLALGHSPDGIAGRLIDVSGEERSG